MTADTVSSLDVGSPNIDEGLVALDSLLLVADEERPRRRAGGWLVLSAALGCVVLALGSAVHRGRDTAKPPASETLAKRLPESRIASPHTEQYSVEKVTRRRARARRLRASRRGLRRSRRAAPARSRVRASRPQEPRRTLSVPRSPIPEPPAPAAAAPPSATTPQSAPAPPVPTEQPEFF